MLAFSAAGFAEALTPAGLITLAGIIYSIVLHETAHAWTADRLGDPTPRSYGMVGLNPLPFFRYSPIWTLVLPVITWIGSGGAYAFGGGATPVDGNFFRFRPKADFLMSIVGPFTNFTLCVVFSLLLVIPHFAPSGTVLYFVLGRLALVNLILAAFNMLPIPPMDGAHVFGAIFPPLRFLFDRLGGMGLILVVFIGWPLFDKIAPPLIGHYSDLVGRLYEFSNGAGTWPGF